MTERTTTQMVGAALVGTAVGAGLALLLAPRSGRETRDMMKQTAHDQIDNLKQFAHKSGRKAKASMEEVRDTAQRKTKQSPVLSAWEEEV